MTDGSNRTATRKNSGPLLFLCLFSIRHAFAIGQNERCFKPTANGPGNVLQIRRSKPLPLHLL
nr:MAG TPA: hypothetical protein [Caudoviricetes sp.]